MFSMKELPSSASTLFSAYASVAATAMLLRSTANDLLPAELRSYLSAALRRLFSPLSGELTLTVDEYSGMYRNQLFDAAELYLRTRIPASAARLVVVKLPRNKSLSVAVAKGEIVADEFDGVPIAWQLGSTDPSNKNQHMAEKKHYQITFDKKFKDTVLNSYLPYVLSKAECIKREERTIKLYSRDCPYDEFSDGDDGSGGGGGVWGSVSLEHPATFETLAMDPAAKRAIVADLDRFLRRRELYRRVGKAWKRGYLLYGPPGTGKSSLVAAMANYLKFDVYDLDLTSVHSNSELRTTLLATSNRSILVMEDIDCSVELKNRDCDYNQDMFGGSKTQLTLSGLLNFIDGLWSSCGDERIIVFTTNHKDRLDPALLRPGRMDVHINMSYCTKDGFRTLAHNYLGAQGNAHGLCGEIEGLIGETEVTPAEVAEELLRSDDADMALDGLAGFLKRKKVESLEKKKENNGGEGEEEEKEEKEDEEEIEPPKLKRVKMSNLNVRRISCRRIVRGGFKRL